MKNDSKYRIKPKLKYSYKRQCALYHRSDVYERISFSDIKDKTAVIKLPNSNNFKHINYTNISNLAELAESDDYSFTLSDRYIYDGLKYPLLVRSKMKCMNHKTRKGS